MHKGTAIPRRRGLLLVGFLILVYGSDARAQCPDGAPPPCKSATPTAIRRTNPALNPRGWIVVPFTNAMKVQDLDWLRDGSANLLSLDMGRWTDISVVPDKRVGDLIRELPAARSAEALTLNDGLAVARRAGAGQLVMGDFFRVGRGARLVASVFDVRSGAKVRTVTQQAVESDSLLTAFGPLARSVLAVPPPADAKTGDIGTSSLDAYQSYLLGVKALNRFDMPTARRHLTRALAIDSTFALAHLAFSQMLQWGDLTGGPQALARAKAAQRFGGSLPPRERALIEAGVAGATRDDARVCSIANALIAQDSTDIQGFFLLGECNFHDGALARAATDTAGRRFRGNWNTAIRAFRRVMELDPTYLGAFEHIIDMHQAVSRSATDCGGAGAPSGCRPWLAYVLRSGDTLELVPTLAGDSARTRQRERHRTERTKVANAARVDSIARRWIDLDPSSDAARLGLGRASMMRGNLLAADSALKQIAPRAATDNLDALRLKLDVAAKLGRGVEARALFDSIVKALPDDQLVAGSALSRGSIDLLFGRLARFDRAAAAAAAPFGPEAVAYQRHVGRALLGIPSENMARDEAAFFASMRDSACTLLCRLTRVLPTLAYAPHEPIGDWPSLAGPDTIDQFEVAQALAARDTARLRKAARRVEDEAHYRASAALLDPRPVYAAHAYLLLRDSSAALRMARLFVDSSLAHMTINSQFIGGLAPSFGTPLWPRMMLLRADLAAAAGARDEARTWYTRVLDLWAEADPEMQATVSRIRTAVARLGPPR